MPLRTKTEKFYDRIAEVHNFALRVNGYRRSVAKHLHSLDLGLTADSVVLDAGSGTGIVTKGFHSAGFPLKKSFALDLSHNSLKVSREQFEKHRSTKRKTVFPIQGNILEFPFADETFDLVLTCGVLEYVPLDAGLKEMARIMKPGSKLVLIPVRPSLVGSVLEILYSFKTHPIQAMRKASRKHFKIVGDYKFPITDPISWSKMIFLLEKK